MSKIAEFTDRVITLVAEETDTPRNVNRNTLRQWIRHRELRHVAHCFSTFPSRNRC